MSESFNIGLKKHLFREPDGLGRQQSIAYLGRS